MKKITTLLLLVVLSTANAFAQQAAPTAADVQAFFAKLRSHQTSNRPVHSRDPLADQPEKEYQAIWNGSAWDTMGYTHMMWNSQNWMTESIEYISDGNGNWEPTDRTVNSKDASGQDTMTVHMVHNGSAWENSERIRMHYDMDGNLLEVTEEEWLSNRWEMMYGELYVNTYDNNNNVLDQELLIWDIDSNKYLKNSLVEFSYNASNQVDTMMVSEYDPFAGTYVENSRYVDMQWAPNQDMMPTRMTIQTYENGSWMNYMRMTMGYTASGQMTLTEVEFYVGTWMKLAKQTTAYDQQDNVALEESFMWNGFQWERASSYKYNNQYDASDRLVSVIEQDYDTAGSSYYNILQRSYTYSSSPTSLGGVASVKTLRAFPNPATTTLQLQNLKAGVLTVTNLNGQLQQMECVQDGNTSLDVATLPAGVYILRLEHTDGVQVMRFVKQ